MSDPIRHPEPVSGRRLLVALAAWLPIGAALFLLVVIPVRVLAPGFARQHSGAAGGVALLVAYLGLLGALLLAFGGVQATASRLGFRFTGWAHLALAPALWLVVLVAGGLLTAALSRFTGPPASNAVELLRQSRDPIFIVLILPTVAFLGPAAEELLFRGALYGWLRGRIGAVLGSLVSAALFAAAHRSPSAFALLFVFGLAAALFYQRTGSTLNSTVMHACQNTTALVLAFRLTS